MTPERLEELVIMAWKQNGETATIAETRAALTAVYPLIRDDVIEECAVHVDALQNHASAGYTAKDTAYSRGCLNTAALISEIIRALKSKDTKI